MEDPGRIVARRVKERREAFGWTQEELSRRSGIRQGGIARIESGKNRNIETSTLIALAKALDVSTDWLLGLTPDADADDEASRARWASWEKVGA